MKRKSWMLVLFVVVFFLLFSRRGTALDRISEMKVRTDPPDSGSQVRVLKDAQGVGQAVSIRSTDQKGKSREFRVKTTEPSVIPQSGVGVGVEIPLESERRTE